MDKVEQLFVRACKSNNPKVRLVSVIRRFYLGGSFNLDGETQRGLIFHLSELVEKYVPMTTYALICNLETSKYFIEDSRSYREIALDTLISRIRCSKASKFVGMSTPRRFKN